MFLVGSGAGSGAGVGVGTGVGTGVGSGAGVGLGVGAGFGVGFGAGFGVACRTGTATGRAGVGAVGTGRRGRDDTDGLRNGLRSRRRCARLGLRGRPRRLTSRRRRNANDGAVSPRYQRVERMSEARGGLCAVA